jgi:hypothetical protein
VVAGAALASRPWQKMKRRNTAAITNYKFGRPGFILFVDLENRNFRLCCRCQTWIIEKVEIMSGGVKGYVAQILP